MPSFDFVLVSDAGVQSVAHVAAPRPTPATPDAAPRSLAELATVDPADMTTAELVATWQGETDPESAPTGCVYPVAHRIVGACDCPTRARRPFNYTTRGACPEGRKLLPKAPAKCRGFTYAELVRLTAADRRALAARPIRLVPCRPGTAAYQAERDALQRRTEQRGYVLAAERDVERYGHMSGSRHFLRVARETRRLADMVRLSERARADVLARAADYAIILPDGFTAALPY